MSLPAGTHMGTVTLTARDAPELAEFYARVVGLAELGREGPAIHLGAPGADRPLVVLEGDAQASAPGRTAGLFHLAVLLPDRAELGHAVRRVMQEGWRLTGASDHFVSEALYLRDPEGNGIEIYRDRPREDWTWRGDEVEMGTVALDVHDVIEASAGEPDVRPRVADGTTIGHVHLSVGDIPASEAFYRDVVGLDRTARYGDEATFMATGGYHHHLGMNVWAGRGLPAPAPGAQGLRSFEIVVPDAAAREAVAARAEQAGALAAREDGTVILRDPAGLPAVLRG